MARAVGLDIGSHAVRAAEVSLGTPPVLTAFGQVGLPGGAVEHGEVIDPATVAAAIRRLWREAHLRDRRVRVGLASLRTIVRQVEMPAMDADELRGALEFQSGEFIPLPPEDTLLDFRVEEMFASAEGEAMMRVLIAAIHRDALQNALTAVREAGLQAVALDLAPFGLVRSLALPPVAEGPEAPVDAPAEAIVSVGSGVTIVVVHETGVVRSVRIVDVGGGDFTVGIEQALGVSFDEAESLKRQLAGSPERREEALVAIEGPAASAVNEIRGSIDFYTGQPTARPLGRVLLTGGGALLEGFPQRLADAVGVPVDLADATLALELGDIGFLPDQMPGLQPYLPVSIGLALGGDRLAPYRINLLPERERRVVSFTRAGVAAGAAATVVIGALALLTMQRNDDLASARDELGLQQATNQQLQAEIDELGGARDLRAEADEARARIASVVQGEISWSRVLQELARVMPGDVWLDSLQATGTQPGASGSGSLTFSGLATDFPGAAAWLQRLRTLPSLAQPWVSQISQGDITIGDLSFQGINFSSTAQVTDAARSERSRRFGPALGTVPAPEAQP